MRYEPYRRVTPEEVVFVAHRRLIAVIDIIENLCQLMDLHNPRDKVSLLHCSLLFIVLQ